MHLDTRILAACVLFPCMSQSFDSAEGCWETDEFNYALCCAHPPGHANFASGCFDNVLSYDRCCSFRYGPKVRHLPYHESDCIDLEYSGIRLTIRQNTSWISGHKFITCALWSDRLARMFLVGRAFSRGQRFVWDVGAGVGLGSIAAALVGHVVRAFEIRDCMLWHLRWNVAHSGVQDKVTIDSSDFCIAGSKQMGDAGIHIVMAEQPEPGLALCLFSLAGRILLPGGFLIIWMGDSVQTHVLRWHPNFFLHGFELVGSLPIELMGWGNLWAPAHPLRVWQKLRT